MIGKTIMVGAVALAMLMGAWIGERRPPISILSAEATPSTVARGGHIVVEYKFIRFYPCSVDVDRYLIDSKGIRYSLDSRIAVPPLDEIGVLSSKLSVDIPENITPGEVTYFVGAIYRCNPIHYLGFPIKLSGARMKFTVTE